MALGGLGVRTGDTACRVRPAGDGDKEPLVVAVGCLLRGVVGCTDAPTIGDGGGCTKIDGAATLAGILAEPVR